VLLPFFRNFGLAEVTQHSEMKRKACFPFAFRSFFRNFAVKIELKRNSHGYEEPAYTALHQEIQRARR
jgi:hypothetical protein